MKIACGSCRTRTALSIGSIRLRTVCARKSRYHPVPTTRFSVMALSGSPESRAASSLPWKPLLARCWSRCLSGRSLAFLLSGGGSVWTLNQGDGTVSRVDEKSRKVIATIQVGIPGAGGDIGYGGESVWPTVLAVPLTRIDASTNKVVRQWVGKGGDSLRFGFDSLWLTDYKKGLLSRIPIPQLLKQ